LLGSRTPYSAHAVICNKRFTHFDDDDDDDDNDAVQIGAELRSLGRNSNINTHYYV